MIKLTDYLDNPIYISPSSIIAVQQLMDGDKKANTGIYLGVGDTDYFEVKETPVQVVELINKASNS